MLGYTIWMSVFERTKNEDDNYQIEQFKNPLKGKKLTMC